MGAKSAIAGIGHSGFSREPGPSVAMLAKQAVLNAVEDANMTLDEVDGLILGQSDTLNRAELTLAFRHCMDLNTLALFAVTEGKGTTMLQAIQHASLAIAGGMAHSVACVFSDTPIKGERSAGAAFSRPSAIMNIPDWEERQGCFGAIGAFALAASCYLSRYGLSEDALASYSIACRRWAELNTEALFRQPLTLDDYRRSPKVVEPFRILDCAVPVNGAVAFLVRSPDRVADTSRPPVYVHGMGQGHTRRSALSALCAGGRTGAAHAANAALNMARIDHSDISLCQIYDPFSFAGLYALEDFGFCAQGAAPEFVASGETSPGGSLPVNTGGGQLSGFYLQGATPLLEAVIQARGTAGKRQVPRRDLIFVSNSGGCLEYHASLVLSPERHFS